MNLKYFAEGWCNYLDNIFIDNNPHPKDTIQFEGWKDAQDYFKIEGNQTLK